jgi:hypothetical protein
VKIAIPTMLPLNMDPFLSSGSISFHRSLHSLWGSEFCFVYLLGVS